ncbi:hypothetical protein QEJ31_09855 [Pigmentibacter sp. JX0631]|uniref:hypothetical protein n=1 Tax=Pigmentibacter sp. JX0631 TaxID=2976982 RepID=UPI002468912F|nr:hypothetical protein [Pigmentibacter sp. JX0631]WGL58830.1 hypothetical protein QEJ31_09855 [Pigmentibacter sp. JX0631]
MKKMLLSTILLSSLSAFAEEKKMTLLPDFFENTEHEFKQNDLDFSSKFCDTNLCKANVDKSGKKVGEIKVISKDMNLKELKIFQIEFKSLSQELNSTSEEYICKSNLDCFLFDPNSSFKLDDENDTKQERYRSSARAFEVCMENNVNRIPDGWKRFNYCVNNWIYYRGGPSTTW